MVLHLTCCSEKAKLVIVVKIIEDIFMRGVWLFYCTQQKYDVHRKFKLLGLKKMWFILNHSEADWTKPAVTILVLLIEAFCPYLGNFSKEIKAVSLLQLNVAVVCQLLCICCIPKFWGCSDNCVMIYQKNAFGLPHCVGAWWSGKFGEVVIFMKQSCVVSYLRCKG